MFMATAAWVSRVGLRTDVSAYRVRQELATVPRSMVLSALGLSARLMATVPDRLDSCWLAAPPVRAVVETTRQKLLAES